MSADPHQNTTSYSCHLNMGRCLQAADIRLGKDDGMNILLIVINYVSNTVTVPSFKLAQYIVYIARQLSHFAGKI